jgi:hypothetical protein
MRVFQGRLWFLLWFNIGLAASFAAMQSACAWLYGGTPALIAVWHNARSVSQDVRANIVFASLLVGASGGGALGWFSVRWLMRRGVLSEHDGRKVLGLREPKQS